MSKKYGYVATISADTSGLVVALKEVENANKNLNSRASALKEALKFDPTNIELLQKNFDVLTERIKITSTKLDALKSVEHEAAVARQNGDMSKSQYAYYNKQIDDTIAKLQVYQIQLTTAKLKLDEQKEAQQKVAESLQSQEEIYDIVHRAIERCYTGASSAASAANSESEAFDKVAESADKASTAMEKIVNVKSVQYDQSAIDYIENYGKTVETTTTAYDKYKASTAETNEAIKQLKTEYGQLDKALSANADNEVLAAQKKEVSNELIEAERYKLEKLENQYKSMSSAFDSGNLSAEQFREFEREIEATKQQLSELTTATTETAVTAYDKYKASTAETNEAIKQLKTEYGQLDKALASNAESEVLALQKKQVKNELIEAERSKLQKLESQYHSMRSAMDSGDIGAEQFREYERELDNTVQRLGELTKKNEDASDSTEELGNSTKELGNQMDDAGKKAASFGDIFKANILSDLVMDGVRKLKDEFVDFAKEGIELASDLTEVQNVVDVTFGDSSGTINNWAKQAATSFGMSELAAKQYTGTLGAMLKSQGITSDSVVQLSTDLVGLAGDIASFYNLDVETAFKKIRSGMSGETEPLKELGINMSVANMSAYALAEGIEKPWKKMSQQEQTMLRYNYLLEQTADAQGDFARTSDSYANQQRIMELTLQNLSAELGEKLLPVALEFTQMISASAPNIMNHIVDIGSAAATVATYLIEHKEAVISLITAYGSFKGAIAVGSAVTGAINAYRTLTTATQAATVAQEANNVAVAANPYVLLISAIVAAGVAIGSYVMQLDSAIEKEKDIKKAADETVNSANAEAATVEAKADRYKRLYEEYKKTGVATGEMIELAKQLQELSPDTISLIDEETGAYKELGNEIDNVIQNIRLKGIEEARSNSLSSYYDNITEYYELQAKAYQSYSKMISGISDETLAELEKGAAGSYAEFFDETKAEYGEFGANRDAAMYAQGLDWEAFEAYQMGQYELQNTLNYTNGKIAEQEKLIEETSASYDKLAESISGASAADTQSSEGSYWGDYYKKRSEESESFLEDLSQKQKEEVKLYEETLQAEVDKLDKRKSLRKLSEEEYYTELKKYLDSHVNEESAAYYKQLSNYEKYIDKKNKAAEKEAENQKKQADKEEKESKKAAEKKIDDDIDALKLRGETDDGYSKEQMWDDIEDIINGLDKQSEQYKKYNAEILKGRKKLADDLAKKDKKAAEEQLKQLKTAADKQEKELEKQYKELVKKKEKAKDSLLGVDLSDTVTDKNGKDKEVLTDLNAEIKKIDKYKTSLEKLKGLGASDSLIEKIQSMKFEDGSRQNFINTLLGLSEKNLQLYFSDWERWQAKAEEVSQDLISDDLDDLNKKTTDAVNSIFGDDAAEVAYEDGAEVAQNFLQGIIDNMGDLNDAATISAMLGITSGTGAGAEASSAGKSGKGGGSDGSSGGSEGKTPIIINLNDKEFIKAYIEDLIASGKRSGGNTFGL